jgi:hypothetical protein
MHYLDLKLSNIEILFITRRKKYKGIKNYSKILKKMIDWYLLRYKIIHNQESNIQVKLLKSTLLCLFKNTINRFRI